MPPIARFNQVPHPSQLPSEGAVLPLPPPTSAPLPLAPPVATCPCPSSCPCLSVKGWVGGGLRVVSMFISVSLCEGPRSHHCHHAAAPTVASPPTLGRSALLLLTVHLLFHLISLSFLTQEWRSPPPVPPPSSFLTRARRSPPPPPVPPHSSSFKRARRSPPPSPPSPSTSHSP